MSGRENRIDPAVLRARAGEFESKVGEPLSRASTLLDGAPKSVAVSAFTMVGIPLGSVHEIARNFVQNDMETKVEDTTEIRDNLVRTADIWESAEQESTVGTEC